MMAAQARAIKAEMIASDNKTPENYEMLAQHWDELAKSREAYDEYAQDATNPEIMAAQAKAKKYASYSRIMAAQARAIKADMIAKANKTSENYEILAQCWDEVVSKYKELKRYLREDDTANKKEAKALKEKALKNAENARDKAKQI